MTADPYYADKVDSLKDIFRADDVSVTADRVAIDGKPYPIIDDVIVLLDPARCPPAVRRRLGADPPRLGDRSPSGDVQFSFGEEWGRFPDILPEHQAEFRQYFDLVDLDSLHDARVADLGCGIGRWSYFLGDRCRELVLVDFSEAIFVARRNLSGAPGALFFLGDVTALPFRPRFADLVICIGVLHHLPSDALQAVRRLARYAPTLLIYLYYALDNRPPVWRMVLAAATAVRRVLSGVRGPRLRLAIAWWLTLFVYLPLITLGRAAHSLGFSNRVPLYEFYANKSVTRIRQDAYDRFFTPIEQRFRREQILALRDTFAEVIVSEAAPYWHFVCREPTETAAQ